MLLFFAVDAATLKIFLIIAIFHAAYVRPVLTLRLTLSPRYVLPPRYVPRVTRIMLFQCQRAKCHY